MNDESAAARGSRVSARGRIVGWIVLTTALCLLAILVTLRSALLGQVDSQANAAITQEVNEFATFAGEGVDPTTTRPYTSAGALMQRYLARQTPETGEALIGVTPTSVVFVDNAADDAGEALAADRTRLQEVLSHPESSGITTTPHGEMRWGRTTTQVGDERGTLIVALFTEPRHDEVDRTSVLLLGVAVAGLLLTAGIAWLAAGRILRPIRQIRAVAERIDGVDLSTRVPVEGRDDMAGLATTFNHMLDRVERTHTFRQHVITEARRHLTGPRDDVERLVAELADPDLDDTRRAAVAATARARLNLVSRTLGDLDLLSRSGRPDLATRRVVSLAELTTDLHAAAVTSGGARRWVLEECGDATVVLDPDLVAEAMTRLAQNAYDHTGTGDEIRLGSRIITADGPPRVRFWVHNDGPPLDQESARRVLEEYRSGEAMTGMGMGLAVVRAAAEAHSGTAWVESGEHTGTRFGIDLPSDTPPSSSLDAERHGEQVTAALGQEL